VLLLVVVLLLTLVQGGSLHARPGRPEIRLAEPAALTAGAHRG
jgi:hypothetical protein